jgi:hypothetical protein
MIQPALRGADANARVTLTQNQDFSNKQESSKSLLKRRAFT